MPYFMRSSRTPRSPVRTLDVRPDDTDSRDGIFEPSLSPLPTVLDHRGRAPVLDQGAESACVGFTLATVINTARAGRPGDRRPRPAARSVSPRMLYEIGRRYDDRIQIYPGSLLTYVVDHLESPAQRVPLLGIRRDLQQAGVPFVTPVAPAASTRHSDFDDAGHEVEAALADIAEARW